MPEYTLVVKVDEGTSQDWLISQIDGGLPGCQAEVLFCGPGSLVQDVADEELPVCEVCGQPQNGPAHERNGLALCEECDLIGASIASDDDLALESFGPVRVARVRMALEFLGG